MAPIITPAECIGGEIVGIEPSEYFSRDKGVVTQIILDATAGGTFVLMVDGFTMNITNTDEHLTVVIPFSRVVNYVQLTSGPIDAVAYVFLERKT